MKKQLTVKELVELHGHSWNQVESTIREVPYTQRIWTNDSYNLVTFDCLLAIAKLIDVDFDLVLKAQVYEYKKSKKL